MLLSFLLIYSVPALAEVSVGGKVEANINTVFSDDGDLKTFQEEKLNLELFLPVKGDTEANFEIDLSNQSDGGVKTRLKKLYLENHFSNFDLSLGRQPISWSFGSLLNPVDFSLGAEAMDEDTSAKNVDAAELYYPFNWNTSFTSVVGIPNTGKTKVGVRGRTYYKGYDLSLNYVNDATDKDMSRVGISAKGDIASVGAYGAVGYYFEQKAPTYLIGIDYSFFLNDVNKITVQAEYLHDQADFLESVLGEMLSLDGASIANLQVPRDLLAIMSKYDIDDFSSIKAFVVTSPLDDVSTLLGGEYHSQLNSNLDFKVTLSTLTSKNKVWNIDKSDLYKGQLGVSFEYSF